MGSIQNLDVQIPHKIIQDWGWFLAFGIALLLLGVVAVVRSVTVTIVSMLFFGWLLVFASGVEIAQAGMVGHWAAAEHHQNGSAFHADPRASGTGFIGSGVPSTDQLRTASTTLTADSVGFLEQLACQFKRVSGWFEGFRLRLPACRPSALDATLITTKARALQQVATKLGEAVYAQSQNPSAAAPESGSENIVDAEFTEVDDNKKKSA